MNFQVKKFDALSGKEVYDICRLRSEVFVLEQKIICEEEFDGKDEVCLHVFLADKGMVVAYCRVVPATYSDYYRTPSIGRVVVKSTHRKKGIAEAMMKVAINEACKTFGADKITISAQKYIEKLYARVGFCTINEPYEEAGIPHVKMVWEKK